VPHIYHRQPADEDRYALFRNEAVLYRRDLLSTIDMDRHYKVVKDKWIGFAGGLSQ
jgi:hypothetical protein